MNMLRRVFGFRSKNLSLQTASAVGIGVCVQLPEGTDEKRALGTDVSTHSRRRRNCYGPLPLPDQMCFIRGMRRRRFASILICRSSSRNDYLINIPDDSSAGVRSLPSKTNHDLIQRLRQQHSDAGLNWVNVRVRAEDADKVRKLAERLHRARKKKDRN